jgi:hypothetical protein
MKRKESDDVDEIHAAQEMHRHPVQNAALNASVSCSKNRKKNRKRILGELKKKSDDVLYSASQMSDINAD